VQRLATRNAARTATLRAESTTDGWLDNVAYTYNAGYTKFTGSFNVPANPPRPQKPETLYYFPGMENLGGPVNILQPVLTWGDETEGAVGGWSVWSWACCPSDITFNSKNVGGLQEGMIVDGVMEKSGDTWRIDTAFTDSSGKRQNTTLLADLGRYTYNWADVTLEVYNLTDCAQHSPGEVKFTDLKLYGASGEQLSPQWSGAKSSSCGGRVTVHDAATISIQHTTGVPIPPPSPSPTPTPTPTPRPTPSPTPTPGHCHAISAVADDSWCQSNCAAGFCPADLCKCDSLLV